MIRTTTNGKPVRTQTRKRTRPPAAQLKADEMMLAEVTAELKRARLRGAARLAVQAWTGQVIGMLESITSTGYKIQEASNEEGNPFEGLMAGGLASTLADVELLATAFMDAIPKAVGMLPNPVADVMGLVEEDD